MDNQVLSEEMRRRVREAVRKDPSRMTMQLARELDVPEVEIVRAMPDSRAVELDVGRWQELIGCLEGLGELHVIVSSGAATLEAVGRFGNFSTTGEVFNVQTPSLDMHIHWQRLGAVFAIEKPGHLNQVNTLSLQFFDQAGHAAFKVFFNFGGAATAERSARFRELREKYRKGDPPLPNAS